MTDEEIPLYEVEELTLEQVINWLGEQSSRASPVPANDEHVEAA